ncbi:hypothetical protein [Rippkaea orientalis]|uniref:hypothetical protein n=1 Tax=Rippkaea orientalis TaxID=2546366 RepID=UPI0001722F59|nr:hypothetical protein [Rippkaea orientalis]
MIDTNVLVSSILIADSLPDKAFKKAKNFADILFSESREIRSQFLTKLKDDTKQVIIFQKINIF